MPYILVDINDVRGIIMQNMSLTFQKLRRLEIRIDDTHLCLTLSNSRLTFSDAAENV